MAEALNKAADGRKRLVYFADPMCSWCWGFSPVMERVLEEYGAALPVELVMGGLRAGNTQVMDEAQKEYILGHWRHVHEASGQPFDFAFSMPPGFIYNTEPACRAVVAAGEMSPESQFGYLKALQGAFYARNRDITDPEVAAALAAEQGLDHREFSLLLDSAAAREKTAQGFVNTAGLGVNGFPTLLGQDAAGYTRLLTGYRSYRDLKPVLETWLAGGGG